MKILIDTNVVLDLILEREPFVTPALHLMAQIDQGHVEGYIAATTITNLFYIVRKTEGREVALDVIKQLTENLKLCSVDHETIQTALNLDLKDFEDGVQLACATLNKLDCIVTRDRQDFAGSPLPVFSPTEFLQQI